MVPARWCPPSSALLLPALVRAIGSLRNLGAKDQGPSAFPIFTVLRQTLARAYLQ